MQRVRPRQTARRGGGRPQNDQRDFGGRPQNSRRDFGGRPQNNQRNFVLDASLVPLIEQYAVSNDISDLDALTDYLRATRREYQRQKLGPFRKMVAKGVMVVRRRASEQEQQEGKLRRLERRHVSRTPGGDDVSSDDDEEGSSFDGSETESEEEELAFQGMEEERHGHNLLNSSLRGFYDRPEEEARGFSHEGDAAEAGTSGRGNVNGLLAEGRGKRKREGLEAFDAPFRRRPDPGLAEGLSVQNQGVKANLSESNALELAVDGEELKASENGPLVAAANEKLPAVTKEYVPKGPDGTRLRRGKKFAKGRARGGAETGSLPEREGGGDGEASFGAAQPKNVWFKDLGGIEGTLEAIRELILYPLAHPEVYDHLRVQPPRGVLLHGPPGCGKTMLAHAIANETGVRFLSISAPEVVSGMSGESEAKIRTLFQDAERMAPALIFIDEIDAITPKRETAQREMERRIVAQLLTCMDALNEPHDSPDESEPSDHVRKGHVIVIGATNRPDSLDPALRRAGRFDREIGLGIPDEEARVRIMQVIAGKLRLEGDFDFKKIAKKTPGFVGADLQALTTEAAAVAVKRIFTGLGQGDLTSVNKQQLPEGEANKTSLEGGKQVVPKAEPLEVPAPGANGAEGREALGGAPANVNLSTIMGVLREALSGLEKLPPHLLQPAQVSGESSLPNLSKQIEASVQHLHSLSATNQGALHVAIPPERNTAELTEKTTEPTGNTTETTEISIPLHERDDWKNPFTAEQLATLSITMSDFEVAIPKVQPSSKREGFATIPDVTWADVGSLDDVKEELEYAVSMPIRCPEQFQAMGLPLATGVLLYGPPGCGKTLVAKAIANDAGANFISIKGPELLNKYVGESERAVRQIFTRARDSFPCILFFDEMDALAPKRGGSDGNAAAERVVNQLLTEMDGLEQRKGVYLLAATNRPDMIDPALLRPGRLDKLLYVPLPSPEGRSQILRTLTRKTPLSPGLDVTPIGKSDACRGFSGADLAALVREACIAAIKEAASGFFSAAQGVASSGMSGPPLVQAKHFEMALAKVSASVSAMDERRYEILREKLRSTRGHLKKEEKASDEDRDTGKDAGRMIA